MLSRTVAKGHPVDAIVDAVIKNGMLAGQIKWLILHPGRITFECKSLDECDLPEKGMLPTANPLVVFCLSHAIRGWQAAPRAVHTKWNEERLLNAMRTELYIYLSQSAGEPIPPEAMARRVNPTVERAGLTYAPELDRLVEMVKEVLEKSVRSSRGRREMCRRRGVMENAQRGCAKDLGSPRNWMLRPQFVDGMGPKRLSSMGRVG